MDDEAMRAAADGTTDSGHGDNFLEGWEDAPPESRGESPEPSHEEEDAPAREEPANVPAPAPEGPDLDGQIRERQEQQRRRAREDVREFIGVFPEAARNYQSIPQEVWDAVRSGMSLVAAYSRYHNARQAAREQAREEEWQRQEAVRRRNAENAARSAGSMRSAGSGHGPKDPFLEGWDEN